VGALTRSLSPALPPLMLHELCGTSEGCDSSSCRQQ